MAQRIFDIENEKDIADLWSIFPDNIIRIEKDSAEDGNPYNRYYTKDYCYGGFPIININWHDKKAITRPIQEATKADIGKLCYFWDDDDYFYGKLDCILSDRGVRYSLGNGMAFNHCRRLTKEEVSELC